MPNVEMFELKTKEYYAVDYVLCKTKDAYDRVTKWYEDFGNPRNTTVLFVEHTSSDPSTSAKSYAQSHPEFTIRPKNFDKTTFFHANGHSAQKSTTSILQCWKERPDLPLIDIYSMHNGTRDAYDEIFKETGTPSNLRFHFGHDVDGPDFGRLLLEASTIICPSKMEGFGHYINQARAAGALVMTTNGSPMNEFIAPDAGILIDAAPFEPNQDQMLSIYGSMEWYVDATGICNAVDKVLAMTPNERTSHGKNCRRLYERQFVNFEANMRRLRALFVY
ncbi:hypothetical protein THRCLA_09646 [Thraustotheca clavata]|uniref:Glycosyl transferase family 1 domain-containing protein n=1 Tax=Thraustotheca clavata TaxID=74557 RepID=A0A1V9YVT7_9STRA|nr:hypothetical protein THRCLA_09646 [Thraustotheca clavata]